MLKMEEQKETENTKTNYDITDERRFNGENIRGLEMKEITKDSIQEITVSVAGMGIDEFKDRINPEARTEFEITADEAESLFGPDACEIAQDAMLHFFGDMLLLGKVEHDCVGKTWMAFQKWDPTTRPVKYNGNGSDAEVNGSKFRTFNWRIAAKMLQIKDATKYWKTMKGAFDRVKLVGMMFPSTFLDDPPQGVAA